MIFFKGEKTAEIWQNPVWAMIRLVGLSNRRYSTASWVFCVNIKNKPTSDKYAYIRP